MRDTTNLIRITEILGESTEVSSVSSIDNTITVVINDEILKLKAYSKGIISAKNNINTLVCPNCNARLEVVANLSTETIICHYCGHTTTNSHNE